MSGDPTSFKPDRGLLGRRGGAVGKAARLPSLRTPRDLTLGGVQKKTFAPNIPSRRKQEEPKPEASTDKSGHAATAEAKKGRDKHKVNVRGRRHERKGTVVQSHSIFEQGPSEKSIKSGSGYVDYGYSDKTASSKKTIKREKTYDSSTKQVLDDLLRDDFIADGKISTEDPSMNPVILPLSIKTEVKLKPDNKEPIKPVKEESQNVSEAMVVDADIPTVGNEVDIEVENDNIQPTTCADLFLRQPKAESDQYVFIQLPDTLPGEPLTKPPEIKTRQDKPEKKDDKISEDTLVDNLGAVSLKDFSEGYIGKLQVLKSGRTRLVLGNNSLNVTMGTPAGFLQELVSVRMEDKSGDMCVLGHINHKLVCVPDMESLLQSR